MTSQHPMLTDNIGMGGWVAGALSTELVFKSHLARKPLVASTGMIY